MLYGAPVWGNTCDSNINNLEIIQNKVLRMVLSAERTVSTDWLRETLNVPKILESIINESHKLYNEQIKNNELLCNIGKYTKETAPFKIVHKLPHHRLLTNMEM